MAIELFIKDTIQHLLHDFKLDTYAEQMKKDGRNLQDVLSLGAVACVRLRNSDRSAKPALEVWDEMRGRSVVWHINANQ